METQKGLIIKAVSGFYYVETDDTVFECKARGIFRKEKRTPLVGDRVEFSLNPDGETGVVEEICPRNNQLERPPLANIDRLYIVVSMAEPLPNTLIIDRMTAIAEDKGIEPVIVVNKTDLGNPDELIAIYQKAGFDVYSICCAGGAGIADVQKSLSGKISAFAGNTGVGKSSLLNLIDPRLGLATGEVSQKLGRGRHTTRHCELYRLPGGGYVADTPGFSAIDMENEEWICKENLPFAFREFLPYLESCKFSSCSHTCEKGCAVCAAVSEGKIPASRHESYVTLYHESESVKDWQRK